MFPCHMFNSGVRVMVISCKGDVMREVWLLISFVHDDKLKW